MKTLISTLFILMFTLSVTTLPAQARDLREAAVEAKKQLDASREKDKTVQSEIRTDRAKLTEKIRLLSTRTAALKQEIETKTQHIVRLTGENARLDEKAAQQQAELNELSGAVRVAAGNLNALLTASPYTVQYPERQARLKPILDTSRFPGIDDMTAVADLFLEEMALAAGIDATTATFISDTGEKVEGRVLTLGGFTSAYQLGDKTGFLEYSQDTNQLYALSALPSRSVRKNLARYMNGETDRVYIDISRGGALKQITHRQSFRDQVEKGGMLVWPILALGVFAVVIGIERTLFLGRVHSNTDKVMGRVNELAAGGAWEDCHNMVGKKKIPVYNVLRAGLNARKENRETLESILQESILKEMPRLERFLPMLNIMGAIAPLLGLLGTVTGMISTFHVITLYGTGDPRMMSGGISTALVTTMLGLAVAIPIMLLYTFLCRRVEHVIGDMEEKAVALTNIIFREVRA
ncbi:MAG: MotA/TolQ/ExbB proton channel family protein [Desulfobacterales bacterium]|nr:MotA/TolQ/ExbB proton channel family protein [Desulfobacterales bacterium]